MSQKSCCGCTSLRNGIFILLAFNLLTIIVEFVMGFGTGSKNFFNFFLIIPLAFVFIGFIGALDYKPSYIRVYAIGYMIVAFIDFISIFFGKNIIDYVIRLLKVVLDIYLISVLFAFYDEINERKLDKKKDTVTNETSAETKASATETSIAAV